MEILIREPKFAAYQVSKEDLEKDHQLDTPGQKLARAIKNGAATSGLDFKQAVPFDGGYVLVYM